MNEQDEIVELLRQVSNRSVLIEKMKVEMTRLWLQAVERGDTETAQQVMSFMESVDEEINVI